MRYLFLFPFGVVSTLQLFVEEKLECEVTLDILHWDNGLAMGDGGVIVII